MWWCPPVSSAFRSKWVKKFKVFLDDIGSWRLLFQKPNIKGGCWECSSMTECLPSMQKALGSIPSTGKEAREGERSGGREGRLKIRESRVKREGEKKLPQAGRI